MSTVNTRPVLSSSAAPRLERILQNTSAWKAHLRCCSILYMCMMELWGGLCNFLQLSSALSTLSLKNVVCTTGNSSTQTMSTSTLLLRLISKHFNILVLQPGNCLFMHLPHPAQTIVICCTRMPIVFVFVFVFFCVCVCEQVTLRSCRWCSAVFFSA